MTPHEAITNVTAARAELAAKQAASNALAASIVLAQRDVAAAQAKAEAVHAEAASALVPNRVYSLEPIPTPVYLLGTDGLIHEIKPEVLAPTVKAADVAVPTVKPEVVAP